MKNLIKYIHQPHAKSTMPVRITIVGPARFGKTTVAKNLASEYGLEHTSVGEALRSVLSHHPETELALMFNSCLHEGMMVLDELTVQALDLSLMDSACHTAGPRSELLSWVPRGPLRDSVPVVLVREAACRAAASAGLLCPGSSALPWVPMGRAHSEPARPAGDAKPTR
ncbi:adenylate kinase 9-like [Heterocephalus glaber]|uniref:Adenylate kinase 9-like n=1 Tax=Heterocephalus glaber TaxID=10181 RepID=A0AAX6T1Z7_HETGA|nr:adenylate kinase 9-like [Heterocephalus glaber]XP_021113981.1 adenylate kinase 9-like [Heterocephalus glaber]